MSNCQHRHPCIPDGHASTRASLSPPPVHYCLKLYRAGVFSRHSHSLLVDFYRLLLTHALSLSAMVYPIMHVPLVYIPLRFSCVTIMLSCPNMRCSGKFSKAETQIIVDAVKVYARNNDVSIEVSFLFILVTAA